MPGAVIVGGVDAHAGAGHTILAKGDSRRDAPLLKRAVAFVQVKLVGLSIVGQQNVGPAVSVVVEDSDAEALGSWVVELGFLRGIFELAVAQVVPQPCRRTLVGLRRAVGFVCAVERA